MQLFSNSPEFFKSNNTVTEAECRFFFFFVSIYRYTEIHINLTSDGWCLQDFCKGTSRWHNNGQQLLWPRRRARWRGQRGSLHHSWRTPHPGNRSNLPRPPPAGPRCCSAREQGQVRGVKEEKCIYPCIYGWNTKCFSPPRQKELAVTAQKMLGGTDGQARNAVYLVYKHIIVHFTMSPQH